MVNSKKDTMVNDIIATWPLMTTPWPVVVSAALYVLVVALVGPKFMETRPAKSLTSTIVVYNVIQMFLCSWWLYETGVFLISCGFSELIDVTLGCKSLSLAKELTGRKLVYYYLLMKLTEFLETVFFVLRKKQNQVSFLHVYHHANMAVATWLYAKHVQCFHGHLIATINTLVHVVMYTYYLLASLGPSIRPYLWWKKYLTGFQMVQFVYIITCNVLIVFYQCNVPWGEMTLSTGNTLTFLVLFSIFYKKNYTAKTRGNKAQ